MKLGFARFAHLIDLKRVAALRGIDRLADGSVRIAAGSTHREIERSAIVGDAYPALAEFER